MSDQQDMGWPSIDAKTIRAQAQRELDEEERRRLIDIAKHRIRIEQRAPWWRRLLRKLPITINWRKP